MRFADSSLIETATAIEAIDGDLTNADSGVGIQEEREKARADFWYFAQHVHTEDIDGTGRIQPYPVHLSFLHRLDDELMDPHYESIWVEKSRRMIVTTHVCLRTLHWMFATDKSKGELFSALFISKVEDPDAKLLIRRILGMHESLPWYLQREWAHKTTLELSYLDGGLVRGMHSGGEGPRQEGYTLGFLDEFAFQENGEKNYTALAQNCKRIWVVSTPNGKGNMFYRVVKQREIPEARVVTLHYSEHPDRKPHEDGFDWYREQLLRKMTAKQFEREHNIAYDVYSEQGHYSEEFRQAMVQRFEWDGLSFIKRGWDFGYNHPACTWSWVCKDGIWHTRRELLGHLINTEDFARRVFELSDIWFPGAEYQDACDPAAIQKRSLKSALGADSDMQAVILVAKSMGRDVRLRYDRIVGRMRRDGHRIVRGLMRPHAESWGLLIHPDCELLIDGYKGGYRLPEDPTPRQIDLEESNPTDDTFVHLADAHRYSIMQFLLVQSVPTHAATKPDHSRVTAQQLQARLRRENIDYRRRAGI